MKEKVWIVFKKSLYETEIIGVFKTPNKATSFLKSAIDENKYYTIFNFYMEEYEIQ